MIDCHICHVKNEDDARFCAECGQRLGASAPPPVQTQAQAPASPQPPSVQQVPPVAARPSAAMPPAAPPEKPRLHSPILRGSHAEPAEALGVDINRLRQMSSRPKEEPQAQPQLPETPYKNPYDPRNDPRHQAELAASQPPAEQHRPRLRSPLLAGEEYDEEDELTDPQPPLNERGARLPISGGANSHGAHLRSPLLGGGGEQEDEAQASGHGGHLRSPLLGGGYAGADRRVAPADTRFSGQERRGLRSPILGGGSDFNEDPYFEEEDPVNEDDPNVLRSPLLAARRPLADRPAVKAPKESQTQTPARPPQPPDAMQLSGKPALSSSYTSLRSVSSAMNAPAQPTPPAPAASQAQPASGNPGFAQPGQPASGSPGFTNLPAPGLGQPPPPTQGFGQPSQGGFAPQADAQAGPAPSAVAPGFTPPTGGFRFGANQEPPQMVPAAFQNMNAAPAAAGPQLFNPAPAGQTQPPHFQAQAPESVNVLPQDARTTKPPEAPGLDQERATMAGAEENVPAFNRRPSRMLAGQDEDVEERLHAGGRQGFQPFAGPPAAPPSPLPKIAGALVGVALLGKLWVLITSLSAWQNAPFMIVDQVIGVVVMIAVIIIAFNQRS